ncbi:anti-repressor SinI family protein [Priestia aryabhattai]|nr:anti-repressor SinI family protein [Priestia megaterium]MDN4861131.1 anti-repressor SinI family protein [Priestia megaterium]
MFNENQQLVKELDQEWIHLMKEAKHLGVSIQEIKELLESN